MGEVKRVFAILVDAPVIARAASCSAQRPNKTKPNQANPNKSKQKRLDLLGFIRQNRDFSMGYREKNKKIFPRLRLCAKHFKPRQASLSPRPGPPRWVRSFPIKIMCNTCFWFAQDFVRKKLRGAEPGGYFSERGNTGSAQRVNGAGGRRFRIRASSLASSAAWKSARRRRARFSSLPFETVDQVSNHKGHHKGQSQREGV